MTVAVNCHRWIANVTFMQHSYCMRCMRCLSGFDLVKDLWVLGRGFDCCGPIYLFSEETLKNNTYT